MSLDSELRKALIPVLDLEDDEMLGDVLVLFTTNTPDREEFSHRASDRLTFWKALGMAEYAKMTIIEGIEYIQGGEDT